MFMVRARIAQLVESVRLLNENTARLGVRASLRASISFFVCFWTCFDPVGRRISCPVYLSQLLSVEMLIEKNNRHYATNKQKQVSIRPSTETSKRQ